MNFVKLVVITGVATALASCSKPTEPDKDQPPPETPDTTTHRYSWEYYFFGSSPVQSSLFRDLCVVSDTEIWLVGDIPSETRVPTYPHGYLSHATNAVLWNGREGKIFAMEAIKSNGDPGGVWLLGVETRNRSVYFFTKMACTELRSDTIVFHDLREIDAKWYRSEKTQMVRDGRIFLTGGPGFLAELKQKRPLGSIDVKQIELPTEIPIKAFAEAGEDDYYIGAWEFDSRREYHFWRRYHGRLIAYDFPEQADYTRNLVTALWCSGKQLFAYCPPYLFMESLADTSDRTFIHESEYFDTSNTRGMPITMNGRGDNDVFFGGHFGTLHHYNGKSVHLYHELMEDLPNMIFRAIEFGDDKVYVAGGGRTQDGPRAVLVVGTPIR